MIVKVFITHETVCILFPPPNSYVSRGTFLSFHLLLCLFATSRNKKLIRR